MTSPDPNVITDLEKLDGPCREMDFRVREAAGCTWDEWDPGDGDTMITRYYPDGARIDLPDVTASKDAAAALTEHLLPGWDWTMQSHGAARVYRYERRTDQFWEHECIDATNPAIALCIAALRALEQEMQQ